MRATALIGRRLSRLVHWLAYQPSINRPLRWILKPVARWLPDQWLRRVPVVGCVHVGLPGGGAVLMESRGGDAIARRLYWGGDLDYETAVRRVFARLVADPGLRSVVVVGANTGLYALSAAAAAPSATVYAFEPLPAAFDELMANVALNRLGNVVGERMAVADIEARRTLHVPVSERYIPTTASLKLDVQGWRSVEVKTVRLDDFVRHHGIASVGLLKIDAEEAEPEVLSGARELVSGHRPAIVCEVTTAEVAAAVAALLAPLGYRWFWISRHGLVPRDALHPSVASGEMDYLLLPEERVPGLAGELLAGGGS